jgi:hypothetical protein
VHFCGRHVAALRVNDIVPGVFVVMLDSRHAEGEAFFIVPFRSEIEEVVRADVHIEAARESRVGVKDYTGFVLVKRAEARPFFQPKWNRLVVVARHAFFDVFGRERNFIIEVEIASVGGNSLKFPTHAFLEGLNLRKRRARNRKESDVPRVQVRNGVVKMIRKERTARATFGPVRAEHEVVDEQLAAAGEDKCVQSPLGKLHVSLVTQ